MAGHMPMRHIGREDLYTDLESRIRYLHSFLDFGSDDIDALIHAQKYVKILIPAVVNIVYHKLLQYDITARAFITRSTSFEGSLDGSLLSLTESSPQINHRKAFMRAYLNKLCSDPSKMEYWEYMNKVGMMHVGLGRGKGNELNVEFVHLNVTMGLIMDVMTEAILSHPRLTLQRKIGIVKALGKVIWIQNDLLGKWHVRDGDEFVGKGREEEFEPEGYLHGKKVLEEFDEEVAGEGVTVSKSNEDGTAGVCPFSGMRRDIKMPESPGEKEGRVPHDDSPAPTTPPSRPAPSVIPRLAASFGKSSSSPSQKSPPPSKPDGVPGSPLREEVGGK